MEHANYRTFQMDTRFFILIIYFIVNNFFAFSQSKLLSVSNDMESVFDSVIWINQSTVITGKANSGIKYSSIDSVNYYSAGYKGEIPAPCRNKNLLVVVSEYIRAVNIDKEISMIISVGFGDSIIAWDSKRITSRLKNSDVWTKISDTIEIPAAFTGNGYILTIYLWNNDGSAAADLDDLSINFFEKKMPTFLPIGYKPIVKSDGWDKIASAIVRMG